jgi:hypothetical protein
MVIAMAAVAGYEKRGLISLAIFVVIQVMWQANAVADVLLTRRENRLGKLTAHGALDYRVRPKPKHRRKKSTQGGKNGRS